MAMSTIFARKNRFPQTMALALSVALGCFIGCSSSDEAPGGGRLPIDKAIAQDRPSKPWSKNVPKSACTKDDECGDGFCDRGHCAAIWTGDVSYGQRCRSNADCIVFLCLEGRCRSCVSTAECIDEPDNQNPECRPNPPIPEAQGCRGVAGAGEGDIAPGFPPRRFY